MALECPNCGVENYTLDQFGKRWVLLCHDCGLQSGEYRTEAEALAAWSMPHAQKRARANERRKVLAEVRDWAGAFMYDYGSDAEQFFRALNKMDTAHD